MRLAVVAIVGFSLLGDCAQAQSLDDALMQPIVSKTTKLAAALDAIAYERTLKFVNTPISEQQILEILRQLDPQLLNGFQAYTLRMRLDGVESSVMVCDAGAKRILMEDAGCSAQPDWQPWKDEIAKPCKFELALKNICQRN